MDVNRISQGATNVKIYTPENNISKNAEYSNNSNGNVINQIPQVENAEKNQFQQNNSDNKEKYDKKELDKAVKKLNKFLEDEPTHAEYSVHKDLGTIMIKIVDDESDKVVLELPPEKILNMIASMCKQVGLLDKKA